MKRRHRRCPVTVVVLAERLEKSDHIEKKERKGIVMSEFDPYKVLKIRRNAGDKEIEAAYKNIMERFGPHVDRNPLFVQMCDQATEAYEMLKQQRASEGDRSRNGMKALWTKIKGFMTSDYRDYDNYDDYDRPSGPGKSDAERAAAKRVSLYLVIYFVVIFLTYWAHPILLNHDKSVIKWTWGPTLLPIFMAFYAHAKKPGLLIRCYTVFEMLISAANVALPYLFLTALFGSVPIVKRVFFWLIIRLALLILTFLAAGRLAGLQKKQSGDWVASLSTLCVALLCYSLVFFHAYPDAGRNLFARRSRETEVQTRKYEPANVPDIPDIEFEWIAKPQYKFVRLFRNGYAWVNVADDVWSLIDASGKEVVKNFEAQSISGIDINPLNNTQNEEETWAVFSFYDRESNKRPYGYVNLSGDIVIPPNPKYRNAECFSGGLAAVQDVESKLWGYINSQDECVIPMNYQWAFPFREGLARVKSEGRHGFIDGSGRIAIALNYEGVADFYSGRAIVKVNGKRGLIDKTGKYILKPSYDRIFLADKGKPIGVEQGNKAGFVDITGKTVVDFRFVSTSVIDEDPNFSDYTYLDEYYRFSDGIALVAMSPDRSSWGAVDENGRVLFTYGAQREGIPIRRYSDGFAIVYRPSEEALYLMDCLGRMKRLPINSADVRALSQDKYLKHLKHFNVSNGIVEICVRGRRGLLYGLLRIVKI